MYLFQKNNKKTQSTYTSLMQIAGIGHKMATQTCERLGISKHVMLRDLSVNQLHQLNQTIHQYLLVDMEYHSFISRKIKSLINISSYRGIRHLQGLPCRGQRTHTNAQTSRKGRYNNFDKKHKLNKR